MSRLRREGRFPHPVAFRATRPLPFGRGEPRRRFHEDCGGPARRLCDGIAGGYDPARNGRLQAMAARIGWEGVFPAVTTQFREDHSLDVEATARVIDALVRDG